MQDNHSIDISDDDDELGIYASEDESDKDECEAYFNEKRAKRDVSIT